MSNVPCDLLKISEEEFDVFLNSFDCVLSDCDGVIWHKQAYPGVGEVFKRLEKLGKKVYFVSNNSLRSSDNYSRLFQSAGITNGIQRLTHPAIAIAEHLKSLDFKKTVFCVASPQSRKILESYGFTCKEGPLYGPEYYGDLEQYLKDDADIGAVVFDSDFRVNLPKLYMASTYLKRPEVFYIAGATDKVVPFGRGVTSIGTGQFTEIVSGHAQREPMVLAKPGIAYAEFIMNKYNICGPSRVLFIGDMIAQDISFGKVAGFKTLLVLTNHTHEDMMHQEHLRPDFYASSLGDILLRIPE